MDEAHPFAALFPAMSGAEYAGLCASMRANGYLGAPIMLHRDGRTLDGRHRERAGAEAGIKVPAETFAGTDADALEFVVAMNVQRRHLNESQRAMVATRVATMQQGARTDLSQDCGMSQSQAATMLNVSPRLVQYARVVERRGSPELVAAVDAGVITVNAAQTLVGLPPEKQLARIERDKRKANGESRQAEDYYRTPARATEMLLAKEQFLSPIWECACGDGAISRVLEEHGYTVISTDLHDRGYGEDGIDFLRATAPRARHIVTNPPFAEADDFAVHALDLGAEKVALLCRVEWLAGVQRYARLFSRRQLARMLVYSPGQTLWRGDDAAPETDGGMTDYAWFVFVRDCRSLPTLNWLPGE
jgi:hypothetical protein